MSGARWGRPVTPDRLARQEYPAFLADGAGDCATWPYPDDFTAEGRTAAGRAAQERAKAVCRACPFRVGCLEWAERTNQEGVYGAATTTERARQRRETKEARMAVLA